MGTRFTVFLDDFEAARLVQMSQACVGRPNYSSVIASIIRKTNMEDYLRWKAKEAARSLNHYQELLATEKELIEVTVN